MNKLGMADYNAAPGTRRIGPIRRIALSGAQFCNNRSVCACKPSEFAIIS